MRGSIYYQTSILTKIVFKEGAKKQNRIDKNSCEFKCVASYKSMESYRKIWNDFGFYVSDIYGIKDFEKISQEHIIRFMYEKIFSNISHKYLQKISSALGKLEFALNQISKQFKKNNIYNFSDRLKIVKEADKHELTQDNYRNRAYSEPKKVIALLGDSEFKIAANIQLNGSSRSEGVCQIMKNQLQGFEVDKVTNSTVGVIQTKEKGGKVGKVYLDIDTYNKLENIINKKSIFKVDYNKYTEAIRNACRILGVKSEGTHGFRWNFAQNRVLEYQNR